MTQGWPSRLWDLENPLFLKVIGIEWGVSIIWDMCFFGFGGKLSNGHWRVYTVYPIFRRTHFMIRKHAFLMHFTAWIWCKHLKNLGFDANKNLGFWWRLMRGVWIWHAYHSQIVITMHSTQLPVFTAPCRTQSCCCFLRPHWSPLVPTSMPVHADRSATPEEGSYKCSHKPTEWSSKWDIWYMGYVMSVGKCDIQNSKLQPVQLFSGLI